MEDKKGGGESGVPIEISGTVGVIGKGAAGQVYYVTESRVSHEGEQSRKVVSSDERSEFVKIILFLMGSAGRERWSTPRR